MTRPHLNRRHGVWACFSWQPRIVGCGYTAGAALRDWRAQVDRLASGR